MGNPGFMAVTHERLAERDVVPIILRSLLRAGDPSKNEPDLYLEIQPESMEGDMRILFAIDHPALVAQVANAGLRPGAPYELRATGTVDAPRVSFKALPHTGPFRGDAGEPPRCGAEDLFTAATAMAISVQARAEAIVGRSLTPEAQALASTLLISQLRDKSGILRASAVRDLLEHEKRIRNGQSKPLLEDVADIPGRQGPARVG